MKTSIVIPVKNQSEDLRSCLDCLSRQDVKPDEIIVVDNNSSEDIRSVCDEFGVIYEFEAAIGSYAARNRGIARSSGDLIGFTDADCRPWSTWVSGALIAFNILNCQAIAGRVNFTFSDSPIPIAEYIDSFSHLDQKRYADNGYGATANLWVRREVFDNVGLFRSDMLSLGDREWGERARSLGVNVVYSPFPTIDHPARDWSDLMDKIWTQAYWKHTLKPFTAHDLLRLLRFSFHNYASAFRDPKIPGISRKIRFILAMHWIRLFQAARIALLLADSSHL